MRVIPRTSKPDYGTTSAGVEIGFEDQSTYRASTTDGSVWCESRSLTEVLEQSEGKDVTIQVERRITRYTEFAEDYTPREEKLIEEWRNK